MSGTTRSSRVGGSGGSRCMSLTEPLFRPTDSGRESDLMNENDWLFIHATRADLNKIQRSKIPLITTAINTPIHTGGVAFPLEYKDQVFELLGLHEDFYNFVGTDVKGTLYAQSKFVAELEENREFGPDVWLEMQRALFKYCLITNNSFYVSCPHGRNSEVKAEEGKLFIRFYSIPSNYKRKKINYHNAFGHELLGGQTDGFDATGYGIPIFDYDETTILAEVVGGTIFVLFDLPHNNDNIFDIMDKLLARYVELDLTPEVFEKHLAELEKKEMERVKRAYITECDKRRRDRLAQCRRKIVDSQQQIERGQELIITGVRSGADAQRELTVIGEGSDDKQYANEFDKLLVLPGVKRVEVGNGMVSVYIDTVVIEYEESAYTIGDFRIDIPTSASGGVRCYNLTGAKRDGELFHPHVQASGSCCLGNLAEGIAKLVAEYQFSIVAQIMIQYLHSYNPDDAYTSISAWRR